MHIRVLGLKKNLRFRERGIEQPDFKAIRKKLWDNITEHSLPFALELLLSCSGIGPGPHQCSHRKTKGTVLPNGLYKAPLLCRSWLRPAALPGAIAAQMGPDEKFLSLNRWRQPSAQELAA